MSEGADAAAPSGEVSANEQGQTAQGGAEGAEAPTDAQKSAAREAIRLYKLKIDGQEVEVDEEELKRGYGHQRAANKILQEGKAARKQAEGFVQMMKDKARLFEAIQKLGHNPRQLAEEYLASQLQREMMDPRDRELADTKEKLRQRDEADALRAKKEQELISEQMKAKYSKEYSDQFVDALKSTGVPPNKNTVAKMAGYISRAAKINFQMTPLEAARMVKEDIEKSHQQLYGDSDAETLVKILGEQGLQKIRAYDTARLKDPNALLKTPQEQGEVRTRSKKDGERPTWKSWRKLSRGY